VIGVAEERIDQLEAFYDAIGRDDRDAAIELIKRASHPDCEMTSLIGGAVEGRTYEGTEGLTDFVADLLGSFEVDYTDREFHTLAGDAVLFLAQVRMKGRESGVEVVQPVGVVISYEDGLARRIATHPSHEEARAAAESMHA
jgi:hypothetical protein